MPTDSNMLTLWLGKIRELKDQSIKNEHQRAALSHSLTTAATQLAIKVFTRLPTVQELCTKFKLLFLIADIDA